MRPTHILITRVRSPELEHYDYNIHVGTANLERGIEAEETVKKLKIPRKYLPELLKAQKTVQSNRERMGHIVYLVTRGGHATSMFHYPKGHYREKGFTPGLGTLLEEICVKNLQSRGVKTIGTDTYSSYYRQKQLKRIGLDSREDYPIEKWLAALRSDPLRQSKLKKTFTALRSKVRRLVSAKRNQP